jgi:hypothetical protein
VLLNVSFDTQDLCAQIFFTIFVKSTVRHRAKSPILQYLAVEAPVTIDWRLGFFRIQPASGQATRGCQGY